MDQGRKTRNIEAYNKFLTQLYKYQSWTGAGFIMLAILIAFYVRNPYRSFWAGICSIGILLLIESIFKYFHPQYLSVDFVKAKSLLSENNKHYFYAGNAFTFATISCIAFSIFMIIKTQWMHHLPAIISFTLFSGMQLTKFYILQFKTWILIDELSR